MRKPHRRFSYGKRSINHKIGKNSMYFFEKHTNRLFINDEQDSIEEQIN